MAAYRILSATDEMFQWHRLQTDATRTAGSGACCRPATASCSSSNASKADRQACDRRWSDNRKSPAAC